MNDSLNIQTEKHYKESTPMETVNKLKDILKALSIDVFEDWMPISSVGTYSLRLTIKGTDMGTNGKGVTQEYAMASAYAEFFERYQNNILTLCTVIWDKNEEFRHYEDEVRMNSLQIAGLDNTFMNMYFASRDLNHCNIFDKASTYHSTQRVEYYLYNEDDSYVTLPFYSLGKKRVEYLPYNTYFSYYGSNGMCAGNTPEEALVQGLSEIMERFVQKMIFIEKKELPTIPESYIEQYPYLNDIYKKLKKQKNFNFLLKDCSFGGKYPVAGLIAIHKNTGKYGIKLGCHPHFPLAIERSFTEANQGIDITSYAHHSILDFSNKTVDDEVNIYNSFKYGIAQYPFQILSDNKKLFFTPVIDVSEMTNKEILNYYTTILLKEGFDILIRDVSYLDFPSYHIIIPTMSEMQRVSDTQFRGFNSKIYIMKLLNNPRLITKENCNIIIKTMDYYSNSQIDNNMKTYYGVTPKFNSPGEEFGYGWCYMTAMCNVLQGNYKDAALRITSLCNTASIEQSANAPFYLGVKYYLEGMAQLRKHDLVMNFIKLTFDFDIYNRINEIFENPELVIIKQYPHHDINNKDNCLKQNCCDYHQFVDVLVKLKKCQRKNPIQQKNLEKLFYNLP